MDETERLIEVFRAPATASVASRLSALMNLEQLGDPRIVRFFLDVLADEREPKQVRLHVLKRLRSGHFKPPDRALVAESILRIVSDHSSECLRAQATLALAEFTDIDNVPAAVGSLAPCRRGTSNESFCMDLLGGSVLEYLAEPDNIGANRSRS